MSDRRLQLIASGCLVVGAALGVAGTFVASAPLRGLAWGLDGVALVVASALLTVHFQRLGHNLLAAGFLVFVAGETLVVSGSAMDLAASAPSFAAGAGLWAAALAVISSANVYGKIVRGLGIVASVLLAAVAVQILAGRPGTPLSAPLPFFAYPFLADTGRMGLAPRYGPCGQAKDDSMRICSTVAAACAWLLAACGILASCFALFIAWSAGAIAQHRVPRIARAARGRPMEPSMYRGWAT